MLVLKYVKGNFSVASLRLSIMKDDSGRRA